MGKKTPWTPRSRVRSALRQVWLRSRERHAAISRDGYTCQSCHRKQTKAKGREFDVQVHHKPGISNWELVIDEVYKYILCQPEDLVTLCKECHDKMEAKNEVQDKSLSEQGKETLPTVREKGKGRKVKGVSAQRKDHGEDSMQQLRWPTMGIDE